MPSRSDEPLGVERVSLSVGSRIGCSGDDAASGVVGAILAQMDDGTLHLLVAAHVIDGATLNSAGAGVPVAIPVGADYRPTGDEYHPISRALAVAKVASQVRVESGGDWGWSAKSVVNPAKSLGMVVKKVLPHAAPSIGRVFAMHAPLHLRVPRLSEILHYHGALEVRCIDSAGEFARPGESGAPVVSEQGDLVGLILGGADGRYFVAPAHTFLAENPTYRLATSADISAHNARLTASTAHVASGDDERARQSDVASTPSWGVLDRFARAIEDKPRLYQKSIQGEL